LRTDIASITPDPNLDRTLYITERKGLVVKRDGPSIWVKESGNAGRRVPVRLINMVVVIGSITIDTGIIALLSQNDVPIMFMNLRGEEVALASMARAKPFEYVDIQAHMIEKGVSISNYVAWSHSKRRKISYLVRSFHAERKDGPFAEAWSDCSEMEHSIARARLEHPLTVHNAFQILESLAREMTISILERAHLNPHTGIMHRNAEFGFARDLCFMIEPEIEVQAAGFAFSARQEHFTVNVGRSCVLSRAGVRKLVEAFEDSKTVLARYVEDILSSYLIFVRRFV